MLDFTQRRNQNYMNVKLKSGFFLSVEEPDLKTMRILQEIESSGKAEDLVKAVTIVLSKNKQKKKFRYEEIEEMFDIRDIKLFFQSYAEFTKEIASDPN